MTGCRQNMRHRLAVLGVMLIGLATAPSAGFSEPAAYSEYDLKAAFIYKFISFVRWPPAVETNTTTIGVLGDNPFGDAFKAVEGRTPDGRSVTVRNFPRGTDPALLRQCQVLYVDRTLRNELPAVLKALAPHPVLTVSDIEGFVDQGGMIGFVTQHQKVRFEINDEAARSAQLIIRSMLKRIAIRVIARRDEGEGDAVNGER